MADTKNTDRELRKKEREVFLCAIVARTINAMENTDYVVRGPAHQITLCKEPVDVVLESKSGAHPSLQVQVVTIPSNDHLEMRDDNGNISKFENRLKNVLIDRKKAGFEVHIDITAEAELHGVPSRVVNRIADLVQRIQREGSWGMHDPEICEYSEDVAKYVSDVHGISFSTTSLFVTAGRGCFVPLDGRFIEEGIRRKGSIYSPKDSSGLVLVIGASSAIVQEQIDSYRSSFAAAGIPFSQVWIVPAFGDRAIALKRLS